MSELGERESEGCEWGERNRVELVEREMGE